MLVLSQISRAGQLLIAIYTCAAIVFTTHRLVTVSLRSHFSHPPPWSFFLPLTDSMAANQSKPNSAIKTSNPLIDGFPESYVYLNLSTHSAIAFGPEMLVMDEGILLSKLFSNSLRPSKIIPFYYRATGPVDREDITVATIVTSNRFKVFARLVERYKGHKCDIYAPGSSFRFRTHICCCSRPKYHNIGDSFVSGLAAYPVHLVAIHVPQS